MALPGFAPSGFAPSRFAYPASFNGSPSCSG